ncbi:MAG: hypothetical protein WB784_04430 [Rhodanobacteraceae bacterium]
MHRFVPLLVALCAGLAATDGALAATRVTVLATDPPGQVVRLARGQNFYLRIGYVTDHPIHIWARPSSRTRSASR